MDAIMTVNEFTRTKIITMLCSGEYPTDKEIADACDVKPAFIQKVLDEDPELAEYRTQARIEMIQRIEKSAMDMAISGRHPIAQQKAQEFMLKHLVPEIYGDNASNINPGKSKRINIKMDMPVISVDENGIPVESLPNM